MAALATSISEEWIRERVGLTHENLDDVKSLSLPGTYHEKITSLGNSLKKFTRLKNLDLSRNSLDSIKGLESCTLLENLNLYYNNLTTLEQLSPLKHNSKLTTIDLRLNPVARTEADYRLFVVHILPNLRVLDDRPVRASEREAAAAHFGPLPQPNSNGTPEPQQQHQRTASGSSKARIVPSGIGTVSTTMDAEDCAVLNMLAKSEAPKPRNTGSAADAPSSEDYQLHEMKELALEELSSAGDSQAKQSRNPDYDVDEKTNYYQSKYPNIPAHRVSELSTSGDFAKEEADAYTAYKGQGHFTANPDFEEMNDNGGGSQSVQQRRQHSDNGSSGRSEDDSADKSAALLGLLDLVDKYWNGFKSLHDNKKFLKLAKDFQSKLVQEGTSALRSEVQALREENSRLQSSSKSADGLKRVRIKLDESEVEMDKLRDRLKELQAENNRLKLNAYTIPSQPSSGVDTSSARGAGSQELEQLRHENYQLQSKLKQYAQMSELAKMLQESHKSLVQTNDHLLREIDELRAASRHPLESSAKKSHHNSNGVKYYDDY